MGTFHGAIRGTRRRESPFRIEPAPALVRTTAAVIWASRTWVSLPWGIDMAKVYLISCRDAGVDCDFQARGSSLDEVMQLCADHGAQEHNMKAFGPELYSEDATVV